MASRAHHWKPTNTVKITIAVQRPMERERISARIISATPKVPRTGAYQGVIRILAANVSNIIKAGPAIARKTPRSSKGRPGCRAVVLLKSSMRMAPFIEFGSSLPACQLGDLDEVAASVVQLGDGRAGHLGWRHAELGAASFDALVVALDVIGVEH